MQPVGVDAWERRYRREYPGKRWATEYDCTHATRATTRAAWVASALRGDSRGHLRGAEVGPCGMPTPLPGGARAVYVDFTTDRRAYENECFRGRRIPVPTIADDAQRLHTVEDKKFDFLIGNHVLEHVPDFLLAIENWVRVVNPGGVVLFAVPDVCDANYRTGERLRLLTRPRHFFHEYARRRYADHRKEAALSMWGVGKPLDARDFSPSELQRIQATNLTARPKAAHLHTWTPASMCRVVRAFAPVGKYGVVECYSAARTPFSMQELRVTLQRRGD